MDNHLAIRWAVHFWKKPVIQHFTKMMQDTQNSVNKKVILVAVLILVLRASVVIKIHLLMYIM